jgi:hypothetical protein
LIYNSILTFCYLQAEAAERKKRAFGGGGGGGGGNRNRAGEASKKAKRPAAKKESGGVKEDSIVLNDPSMPVDSHHLDEEADAADLLFSADSFAEMRANAGDNESDDGEEEL